MRIAFMGTPDFAVPCLERLLLDGHTVCAVFTQPDKPSGRHHSRLIPPAVKELALRHGLPVHQPATLRDGGALAILRDCKPDLIVVVAYGNILPQEILELPPYGCINIHGSLLPQLRGAAPVQWAILNGMRVTGVTSMQMDAGIDTGDMLLSARLEIGENETAGELFERLAPLGAAVLHDTLLALENGSLTPQKQDDALASCAPLLGKEIRPVDWSQNALAVHNKIRGLSPWPGATARFGAKTVKIHASACAPEQSGTPGTVLESAGKLVIACGENTALELLTLQPEGKKAMSAAQYLAGNPLRVGESLQKPAL